MSELDFNYIRPQTPAEALSALETPGARIIAGGTDLILAMREGKTDCRLLVDVTGVEELTAIRVTPDEICIGAAACFTDIAADPVIKRELTALAQAASKVGSPQIRNRGTIGGNLATGSAAGDTLCPSAAFGAAVTVLGPGGETRLPLEELWTPAWRETLSTEALLTQVSFPRSALPPRSAFVKLGRRESLAISRLSLTLALWQGEDERIYRAGVAVGSAGLHAYRVPEAETLLRGVRLAAVDETAVSDALSAAIGRSLGKRATARYKAQAIRALCKQALEELR